MGHLLGVLRINGAMSTDPVEIKDQIVDYYDTLHTEQSRVCSGLGWMGFLSLPLMQMNVSGSNMPLRSRRCGR
jgi:hypothetical protein